MEKSEFKKIDIHAHAILEPGPERLRTGTFPTPDQVRAIYDVLGIEKGVEQPLGAPEHMHDPITSRMAQAVSEAFPDVLGWWFCYLDPRMGSNLPTDNLSYYIDYFKERGARGCGEMQANIQITDPRMLNLFRHCEMRDFPVLVHIGVPNRWTGVADDAGLPGLEYVLRQFPKLRILGHSFPFWGEISAVNFNNSESYWEEIDGILDYNNRNTLPKGKVIEGGRLPALMEKYPNLLCDLSAVCAYNAITRDPEFGLRFLERFHERILYGTDIADPAVWHGRTRPYATAEFLDNAYANGDLSHKAYVRICRENALELLG
jgi:predicted TIM-barrel fold metal-dependent hydrolase